MGRLMEGFQPSLMVAAYIATRTGDAERGPLVRLHSSDARKRLLEDGELVWVYGPRRHELAMLVVDDTVAPGTVAARDILGIAPAEIVRVVKHDFDAARSTRNLG
jgi:anaerobic selenocysteine-containing dehydrogenase